jgi:hypothetical protein
LSELEADPYPSTFLDLVTLQSIHEHQGVLPTDGSSTGFRKELHEAMARRIPVLEEHGVLQAVEESGGRLRYLAATLDAEERIERSMKQRDRGLIPLSEVERNQQQPVVQAKLEQGRAYQGRVVAMATDSEGRAYAVLHTDPTLTAVPATIGTVQVGQEIHARVVAQGVPGERPWILAWQIEALELGRTRALER